MSEPRLKNLGAYYDIEWPDYALTARVARLKQHSDGKLTCQLTLRTTDPDHDSFLGQQQFIVSSAAARQSLRKTVEPRYKRKVPWDTVIEQLCFWTTQEFTRGQPIVEIGGEGTDITEDPEWLVRPIIYKDAINVFYGDGASGKSTLAAALAICAQLPFYDNPLNLGVPEHGANVLWLDYEGGKSATHRNIRWLVKGFELPQVTIPYRFGMGAFVDEFEEISKAVAEWNTKLLILDAIGGAIGSANMNDAQTATALMNALRTLNITTLLIHHQPKNTPDKTAFGSGYFTYQARNVWEVTKQQAIGSPEMSVGLRHRKCNWGNYQKPIAFRFEFESGIIRMKREDPMTLEGLTSTMKLKDKLMALLVGPAKSFDEICDALPNDNPDSILRTLNRYKGRLFIYLEDKGWGRLRHE